MISVNSTIKRILKEKNSGIISGVKAMRDLLEELRKQVMAELGKAALGSWDSYYLNEMLGTLENNFADFAIRAKGEISGQLDLSLAKGIALVDEPLKVSGLYSGFNISSSSLDVLKDFTFRKIDGLSKAAWDKVQGELTFGVLGGRTPQEVAAVIGKNLKDPSIFRSVAMRAEAITKTELGRVFSTATQNRMEEAVNHVEGLEKKWRHAGHPKEARADHLAAEGIHVPVNDPFPVFDKQGYPLMYPRDPGAEIGEVINCGCDHVPWHESWQQAA